MGQINKTHFKHLSSAKAGAKELRSATTDRKNQVLLSLIDLIQERQGEILKANSLDLKRLPKKTEAAFRDRLLLNKERIDNICASLQQVIQLTDPVGEELDSRTLENDLILRRIRSPLGVIFMIFESRPNVAIEAFSLALKSGNVLILRGGKESMKTTSTLYEIIGESLMLHGFSPSCFWGITDPDRKVVKTLLKQRQWIDVVVPRGGESLIEFVVSNSEIPIIKNDRGLCHVYIHEDADFDMALDIVTNSKIHRPGVCNSMETLLVHEKIAKEFLLALYDKIAASGVDWYACVKSAQILKGKRHVTRAREKSWDTEYLDLKMNCRVVKSFGVAVEHIDLHGSKHSEAIVTKSESIARKFQSEVDAAAVYWNASTRFTDGFEFGLGGELGISTQKLHVRGPVGLRELTSARWIIDGKGQVRE
ncbi:MAG: glutamate-5-semialdehyde dehydrogenase [Oligoflexia bacterium]|nr:glutamate-5-semialdehyde dehydrogenase [Oligoflexia bacterium]